MSDYAAHRYVDSLSRGDKARRLVWECVWLLLFRPTPRWTLIGWRSFLLRSFGATVGEGCRIDPSCRIWDPRNLTMGDYVALGPDVDCYTMDRITIGSKTTVSQRSFLCTGSHDTSSLKRPLVTAPIVLGDHVWIAAEVMVMPGCTIGDGTVVGARSLVIGDLAPWMICAGHPCSPRRPRKLTDASSSPVEGASA